MPKTAITKPAEEDKGLPWGWIIGGVVVVGGLAWLATRSVGAAVGAPGAAENPVKTKAERRAYLWDMAKEETERRAKPILDAWERAGKVSQREFRELANMIRVIEMDRRYPAENPNVIYESLADATEFSRRRSLPGIEVRRMSTGRSFDVFLSLLGRDIGSMHQTLKRGKVSSVMFLLPPMPQRENPSPPHPDFKIYLERVKLDRGGYEKNGRYWGVGAPLYRYSNDSGTLAGHIRALSRAEAKEKIRFLSPSHDDVVSFYRA